MKKCRGLPQSSFSLWSSLGRSCFSSSLPPLCRMSDPVSAPPLARLLAAWERHGALRHKQNTDKNTRRAMCCRPVSQDAPNPLSPISIHLVSLSFSRSLTQTNSMSGQRANRLLATTNTPGAVGIIRLALSPQNRAVGRLMDLFSGV